MMNRKDREALAEYKRLVGYWMERVGLGHWDYIVRLEDMDEDIAISEASVGCHAEGKQAMFRISPEKFRTPEVPIEELAVHEVSELLLMDVRRMLVPTYSRDLIDEKLHEIINVIVRLLCRKPTAKEGSEEEDNG